MVPLNITQVMSIHILDVHMCVCLSNCKVHTYTHIHICVFVCLNEIHRATCSELTDKFGPPECMPSSGASLLSS